MGNISRLPRSAVFAFCAWASYSYSENLIWEADFSNGDLSGWTGLLHEHGLSVQNDCAYRGEWAGQVTLTGEDRFIWREKKHLNRSEFKYLPQEHLTQPGTETFFGWSFYLPEKLTETRHETGYWESQGSWQQIFRFNIVGSDLSFQASGEDKAFWSKPDFALPGKWQDVAMHIHWSTDPEEGFVEVWLNGERQQRNYLATLANDEDPMFVQLGLLRDQQEAVESILFDNIRHGKSMEAVLDRFDPEIARECDQVPEPNL